VIAIFRGRSVFFVDNYCILDLQLGAKIDPAVGCAGRGNKE
jgi:hypothetical protein